MGFEYTTKRYESGLFSGIMCDEFDRYLNAMAAEGWEFVNAFQVHSIGYPVICTFKRILKK